MSETVLKDDLAMAQTFFGTHKLPLQVSLCWLLALSVLKIRKETANQNLSRHLLHVEMTRKRNR